MYRVLSLREPHNGGYVILHYIIKEEFGTKTSYAQIDTQGRKMIHNEFKGRFVKINPDKRLSFTNKEDAENFCASMNAGQIALQVSNDQLARKTS
jgi:hypothetical protein